MGFYSASVYFLYLRLSLCSSFFGSYYGFGTYYSFIPVPLFYGYFFASLEALLKFFLSFFAVISATKLGYGSWWYFGAGRLPQHSSKQQVKSDETSKLRVPGVLHPPISSKYLTEVTERVTPKAEVVASETTGPRFAGGPERDAVVAEATAIPVVIGRT